MRYKNTRDNGILSVIDREESWGAAFENFICYEIGFGTTIVDLSLTRVVCSTDVLGATDVVEFSGTAWEMQPFIKAARVYRAILLYHGETLIDVIRRMLPRGYDGGTLIVVMADFANLLKGQAVLKVVCLLSVDVIPSESLLQHDANDLAAAALLHYETGMPMEEILL